MISTLHQVNLLLLQQPPFVVLSVPGVSQPQCHLTEGGPYPLLVPHQITLAYIALTAVLGHPFPPQLSHAHPASYLASCQAWRLLSPLSLPC